MPIRNIAIAWNCPCGTAVLDIVSAYIEGAYLKLVFLLNVSDCAGGCVKRSGAQGVSVCCLRLSATHRRPAVFYDYNVSSTLLPARATLTRRRQRDSASFSFRARLQVGGSYKLLRSRAEVQHLQLRLRFTICVRRAYMFPQSVLSKVKYK
jgi:hypothetical protein